jgi:hypothetical protein
MRSLDTFPSAASSRFKWEALGLPSFDLSTLELPFSMDEIKRAIDDMAMDKAPGPDGFSGTFFRSSWDTIKNDLHVAMQQIYTLDKHGLKRIRGISNGPTRILGLN